LDGSKVGLVAGTREKCMSLPVIEVEIPGYSASDVVTILTKPAQLGHCIGRRESVVSVSERRK
jgi:hypothetical protein